MDDSTNSSIQTNGIIQKQGQRREHVPKRSLDNYASPAPKRMKFSLPADISTRNPVAVLNELRTGLTYAIKSQSGPVHSPVFTLEVTVDGHIYTGTGRSKKLAKQNAATNALKAFIQFPSNCKVVNHSVNVGSEPIDFTSDIDTNKTGESHTSPINCGKKSSAGKGNGKSAVMIVNELYPCSKYVTVETDDAYAKFKVTVTIEGQAFVGTGSNKRSAKLAACATALSKLLTNSVADGSNNRSSGDKKDQNLVDQIGRLVNDTFQSVMRNQPIYSRRKVLAGVVMQRPGYPLQVVAVTTGTKCISGEHISINGRVLNDMHAEILARRVLVHYLYAQMEFVCASNKESNESIFELFPKSCTKNPNATTDRSSNIAFQEIQIISPETSLNSSMTMTTEETANSVSNYFPYHLKDGVKFHLYINTAPCGDGRIFSPHEDVCKSGVDNHPNRASRGQLRTKIESGEGTVPIKGEIIQTWDGVLLGTRLLTMSCSDKIARWNVLGIQGALLSTLIPPIYFSSVVLASLFHERHLYRALCGRIEPTLQGLPTPYVFNRPELNAVASSENRQPTKAPNFSINWMCHEPTIEVINTTTGRPDLVPNSSEYSRLCKHALYKKFLLLTSKLKTETLVELEGKLGDGFSYGDVKHSAVTYQIAKDRLYEAFAKGNLGIWVKKPMEQDQFIIDR